MERKVVREGGMRKKFDKLISMIIEEEPRCRIYKETSSYISIGLSTYGGATLFEILLTFKTVTIIYKTRGKLFGNHKLQWDFPVDGDQEYMVYKMNKDIGAYFEKYNLDYRIQKSFTDSLKKNNYEL